MKNALASFRLLAVFTVTALMAACVSQPKLQGATPLAKPGSSFSVGRSKLLDETIKNAQE